MTARLRLLLVAVLAAGCSSNASHPVDAAVDARPDRSPDTAEADAGSDASAADAARDLAPDFPRQPSCTTVRSPLVNPDFETPAQGTAIPGWTVQVTGGATATWEPLSGYAGTGAVSLRVPEGAAGAEAVLRQSLDLDPNTAYNMRARVALDNADPRGDGPFLLTVSARTAGRTWSTGPRKQDRTDLDYLSYGIELATGSDGHVDVELRTVASGHFVVDDVAVECNPRAQRFEGATIVANLDDSQVVATPPVIERLLGTMDRAVHAFADLTGAVDPGPKKISTVSSRTPSASPELRGDPVLWPAVVPTATWALPDYLIPFLASALARGFDRPAWLFDDGFADLYVYHAVETLNLRVGAMDAQLGPGYRSAFEASYKSAWMTKRCAEIGGLIYKEILIRDQVGWDPFKKTFRDLAALAPAAIPASRWQRLQLWHTKLGQNAGMDVMATFTADEKALLEARFNPPPLTVVRLADLPPTTASASLATAAWESAYVGVDRPSRNRLPNDCPLLTGAGTIQPVGLYAYAFSQYVFRLGRSWKKLSTGFALQAGQTMGSVIFQIRGDGKQLFRSPVVKADTPLATADVDVTGVDVLQLLVTDSGDSTQQDLGLWLDPRLSR